MHNAMEIIIIIVILGKQIDGQMPAVWKFNQKR